MEFNNFNAPPMFFFFLNKKSEIGKTGGQWGSVMYCSQQCCILDNFMFYLFFKILSHAVFISIHGVLHQPAHSSS